MEDTTDRAAENREAREYERIHNWLFLIRILLTTGLLALYLFSGASRLLAEGLAAMFGPDRFWLINGAYILVSVFAYTALIFPLTCYNEYVLEHHYGLSNQTFRGWLTDFFKSTLIDLLLCLIFFECIYALLHWAPQLWWVYATVFYVLFAVVLTTLAPVVIMPLFNRFEPLENEALTDRIARMMEAEGIHVIGVYKWGLQEKTNTANAAFTGLGRTKRIILSDTLLDGYSEEEILAVLAHETGHYRNKDLIRLLAGGTLLAAAGFAAAHAVLTYLVQLLGFSGIDDIAAMPVFLFCMLIFSLFSMPLSNAYSRRREYAADAYAVQTAGTPDPLVRALEKLADQNLADKEPHPLIELLMHSHPSLSRRIRRAQTVPLKNDAELNPEPELHKN
jgi:STE24 endopeptidase